MTGGFHFGFPLCIRMVEGMLAVRAGHGAVVALTRNVSSVAYGASWREREEELCTMPEVSTAGKLLE